MMKLWKDGLFLFAVVAGLVYEFLYEPMLALVSLCARATVTATAGTWRRLGGERVSVP
jgi:hypothetical protein